MNPTFSNIALIGNTADARVSECMLSLAGHLIKRSVRLAAESSALELFNSSGLHMDALADIAAVQLVIAIGGDGTVLHASRLVAGHDVPLLGVNRGRLGFLTDIGARSMLEDVDLVLEGRFSEDHRSMLRAHLEQPDAPPRSARALNDVVIQKVETGRMIDFETHIDGGLVNAHGGDGLVVATATGSTAYALSCGGPIVEPALDVWVLAPVCPHTLSDRPVIVSAQSRLMIQLTERTGAQAQVACDGETLGEMDTRGRLFVEKAAERIVLLHPSGYDYYRVLRSKLHWGRGGYEASEN